jgi:endoglycosylceramidase
VAKLKANRWVFAVVMVVLAPCTWGQQATSPLPPQGGANDTVYRKGSNTAFAPAHCDKDPSSSHCWFQSATTGQWGPVLRTCGRNFVDTNGRVVILRGINLAGNSKVPPFLPLSDPSQLDVLPGLGFNVIRLVFIWEAFEPQRGVWDLRYLAMMRSIAEAAWARGMYVIIDFHQDGFSRFASRGSGDGFPAWAISPRSAACNPDNWPRCWDWTWRMMTDTCMHKSFKDFYANTTGVRTRYLDMVQTVAQVCSQVPGVIGYDVINEPWGDERQELYPLYRDAAQVIRSVHPNAILFLEGHIATNTGLQTKLPRPKLENVAYAPHFYKPATIVQNAWNGLTITIDRAFAHMNQKASEWDVPLFVGEYGVPAEARGGGDYLAYLHDRLDDTVASGAQWNYTPGWTHQTKDGWNGEDFSLLDASGRPRPSFRRHPYPRAVAGVPGAFRYVEDTNVRAMAFQWQHCPERGETEIHLPGPLFPSSSTIVVEPADVMTYRDEARQLLICRATRATTVSVKVISR